MKNIEIDHLKVSSNIKLSSIPTHIDVEASEKKKEKELDKIRIKLSKLQDKLYAHNKYGVLICLQGMDTAGKDSLVREVFKEFNARGVVVHSFKTPNANELEHDFLWRHYIALPEKGKFSVFNRTHYENVLVTRVHPNYILNENIPGITTVENITTEFWENRFESINNFEKHISQNGIIILKFFLHLSKEEQRHRLIRRLETEKHNWKFSPSDLNERELWDEYQRCYEEAINKTSKAYAPWYIIPADNKETARYLVAKSILKELEKYTDIKEPELEQEIKDNIKMYRDKLASEQ
ncbi:PPK2 family polyphosphate kinase [Flavobacterium cyclinae]|uniref:PPK2 family polyphosphate kinase n=1 Tax=Flavobacterium cyclinae TaxID=2895947 RepID=UPI001E526A56|nr:PPK2 family polyphosphate kinase [Flavobacterium cyclinae]UGS20129.1 polyphosphate kinase 2 family protein [Flavobacterium cyclinae]